MANVSEPRRRPVRIVPPVYLLAAIVTMIALHSLLPATIIIHSPWRWLGAAIATSAFGFAFWAVGLFSRHKTTIKPGDISSHLVTVGPYRYTRNPMYVSMTLLLAGVAVMLGSATPWLVIPLFVAVINHNVIPVEEAVLGETFGDAYRDYCRRVRRWV